MKLTWYTKIYSQKGYGAAWADNLLAMVARGETKKARKLLLEMQSVAAKARIRRGK